MIKFAPVRVDQGDRENNLNLLRLVAAMAVMVSHAWPIVHGPVATEPWKLTTGYTLGTVAVMVFFGLSGFLITASWHRSMDAPKFLRRRALRLLPGLWVMLLLTVFVFAPALGVLPLDVYFSAEETWRFLWRNASLMPIAPALPGVFEDNPYPAVAGSIWTLHYEAVCYLGLLAAGMTGMLRRGFVVLGVGIFAAGSVLAASVEDLVPGRVENLLLLGLPFAFGSAAWLWRHAIRLTLLHVALLTILTWMLADTFAYPLAFATTVVGTTLWLGFVPCRWARAFNRAGDYSYGLYLYAFPMQGAVQALFAPDDVGLHLVLVTGPVLILSILSWWLIERPCLHGSLPITWVRRFFASTDRSSGAA